jgi:hypothetical protein
MAGLGPEVGRLVTEARKAVEIRCQGRLLPDSARRDAAVVLWWSDPGRLTRHYMELTWMISHYLITERDVTGGGVSLYRDNRKRMRLVVGPDGSRSSAVEQRTPPTRQRWYLWTLRTDPPRRCVPFCIGWDGNAS